MFSMPGQSLFFIFKLLEHFLGVWNTTFLGFWNKVRKKGYIEQKTAFRPSIANVFKDNISSAKRSEKKTILAQSKPR